MREAEAQLRALEWRDDTLWLAGVPCRAHAEVAACIVDSTVRGERAVALAGAYGMVLASLEAPVSGCRDYLDGALEGLGKAMPSSRELARVLARLRAALDDGADTAALLALAKKLHAEALEAEGGAAPTSPG